MGCPKLKYRSLTEDEVKEVRERLRDGRGTYDGLAHYFGVDRMTLVRIMNGTYVVGNEKLIRG